MTVHMGESRFSTGFPQSAVFRPNSRKCLSLGHHTQTYAFPMMRIIAYLGISCLLWLGVTRAQSTDEPVSYLLDDLELRLDTAVYRWQSDQLQIGGQAYLAFLYEEAEPVVALHLLPRESEAILGLDLLSSADYEAVDTTLRLPDGSFRTRLKLSSLSRKAAPVLLYRVRLRTDTLNLEVPLFPLANTQAMLPPQSYVWYIGQEQEIPIESSHPRNIEPTATWERTQGIAYRIVRKDGMPWLRVIPREEGTRTLRLPFKTFRPQRAPSGPLRYEQMIEPLEVTIKRGRNQFIALDQDVVELPRGAQVQEVDVSFDLQVALNVKRTYRLEAQDSEGGPVVADLFIREISSSNEMKATLRAYTYHRRSEGMLYLKDRDQTLFTMNLDIVPTPHLDQVQIRRADGKWQSDLTIYPGERIDLRLRGESLTRTQLQIPGLLDLRNPVDNDSIRYRDEEVRASLRVPLDLKKRELPLVMDDETPPFLFHLSEYQRPRELDFVRLTYERRTEKLTTVPSPIEVQAPLSSFQFRFISDSIDLPGHLYGPQYLDIAIEVWSADGQVLEERHVEQVCICPGPASPRNEWYDAPCVEGNLKLNDLLETPSYELPGWSRLHIEISHQADRYEEAPKKRSFDIIPRLTWEVGLEVSMPVPIILARFNGAASDNLTSVGLGAFAQLRFYRERGINELVPVQASLGIMSTDVFSFETSPQRDWALCAFAAFYPITSKQRWSVPLYLGGGYLLDEEAGFFFLGPGLSVQF